MASSSYQNSYNDGPPMNVPDLPMFPDAQRDDLHGMDKNQWSTLPSPQQDHMYQHVTSHRPQHKSQAYRTEVPVDAPYRENEGIFSRNQDIERRSEQNFNTAYNNTEQTSSSQLPPRSQPRRYPPPRTSSQQMHSQFNHHTQAQQNPTQVERQYEIPPAFSDDSGRSSGYHRDKYAQCNNYLDRSRSHEETSYTQRFSQNHNRNGNRSGQCKNVHNDSLEYGEQRHIDRTEENLHHDYQTSRAVLGQSSKQQNQRLDTNSPLYYPHPIAKTRGRGSENQFQNANVPENRHNEIWIPEEEMEGPKGMGNTSEYDDYYRYAQTAGDERRPGENQCLDQRQYNTPTNLGKDDYQLHEQHLRAENQHLDQPQYNTPTHLGKDGYQWHEHHLRAQPYSGNEGQQRDTYSPRRQMRGNAHIPPNYFPPPSRMPNGGAGRQNNNPGRSPGSNHSSSNLPEGFHEFGRGEKKLSRKLATNQFPERQYQLDGTHYPIQTPFPNNPVRHGSISDSSTNNRSITTSKPTVDSHDRELYLLKEIRSATEMQKGADNEGDRCFWTKQLDILKRDLEALQEHNKRHLSSGGSITVANGADSVLSSKSHESRFSIIKVRAPTDLPGGYQFKTNVDGKAVSGTVPQGGVTMGEIFPISIKLKDQVKDIVQVKGIPVALSLKELKISDASCEPQFLVR